MGSAAEVNEPTTAGTEKLHQPVKLEEEEEEQVVELERKTLSFPHGKRPDSADGSTITTNNSSSSSFSEGIPDLRNGEGEHIGIENLEVPESPVVGFHEEHHDGNVFFDGEEGSESADAEPDAHESHTAEKKEPVSENGSASEDNKGPSGEIEEVQDTDLPKEVDAVVVQRTGDVIEEEVDIDDVEDYNVEKVLDNQETHDLFCPNCHSCITKRVVLKKRKRKISHAVPEDPKRVRGPEPIDPILRSEDNEPSPPGGGDSSTPESFFYKCLSCFSIFIPKGVDSKPVAPSETVERLNTQPKPQEEATAHSNWFGSKKKEPPVQQVGAMPSMPEASLPRDNPSVLGEDTAGSTANIPSKTPARVQEGPATSVQDVSEISVSQDNKPVDDTPLIQVANSNDTSKGVNSGATVENRQQFLVPSVDEEQTQQKIDRDDGTSAAEENHSPDKGRLSPIQPSRDMNISNIVTSGPDGVRVETIFHTEGVSHLFEGTDPRKPDFGLAKVTGVVDSGDGGPIRGIDIPPLPVSSLEEGTLTEPLVRPAVTGPIVEGRKVEILKSIVYGGLIEAITSLGVISSAAGSGASTLNILVLGLANLFGGLILIIHNLQELREEEPITTEDNQTNVQEEGRYKRLLGRRENFTLHVTVSIISFIITGLLPPIVYYFSFSKTHNRDYKVASVFGASLLCIVLLAIAKAHVRSPRGSHLKSVLKYAMIAVSVSGISYVVGNFVDQLLEKYGWSDGSETPAGEMMLSLLGRKAGGSFGYSSSY
ncbi:membrane protein of ER body-like protein isoform X2 [Brassica rapa]|uniref:membrane protein of ER body-like protein isoform X2 n=1 Tax=Brassica campestris TaxID=3711 RepID=UPI00142E133F|nr:membrane protein of ER body-like protein isoform X2 [Brassica rapa]